VFPIALIFLPRLWSIARAHNYVTPADFVRGRYGSRGLSLAIAFTGILALMPYIALQLAYLFRHMFPSWFAGVAFRRALLAAVAVLPVQRETPSGG
jgi:Na+/proline symporter